MEIEKIKGMFVSPSEKEDLLIAYVRTAKEEENEITLEFRGTIQKLELTKEEWQQYIISNRSFEEVKNQKYSYEPIMIYAEVVDFKNELVKIRINKEEGKEMEFTMQEVMEAFELEEITDHEVNEAFDLLRDIEIGYFKNEEHNRFKFLEIDKKEMIIKAKINDEEKELTKEEFIELINEWQEYGEEDRELDDLSEETNVVDMKGNPQTKLDLAIRKAIEDEKEKIKKYGFVIHNVFDNEKGMNEFHTHGIENIFENLSIENPNEDVNPMDMQIVLPLEPMIAMQIFHGIVENLILKGKDVKENKDKILRNYDVGFLEVESEGRKLLRILIPDENGKLPNDEDCQLFYKKQIYTNGVN